MSLLYGRKVKFSVDDGGSQDTGNTRTLDLSELHIQFRVVSAILPTPKYAEVRIWNLDPTNVNLLMKEFKHISLSVGYGDSDTAVIFAGGIARISAGSEDAVNSFVDILAQDGDAGINWAVTNKTLGPGWTDDDVYDQLISDFSTKGLSAGSRPDFDIHPGIRGLTLQGQTSSLMTNLAQRQGCDWFVEGGQVYMVKHGDVIRSASIPTLTPATGLLGVPVATYEGVQASCLIDPRIATGGVVNIQNSLITQLVQREIVLGLDSPQNVAPQLNTSLGNGFGQYKVLYFNHAGDTRGNEWSTNFVGIAVDGTVPLVGSGLLSVPSNF